MRPKNPPKGAPVVVFTAPGSTYEGALEPGPKPAVRVSGETYRPGDSIGGERIIGVSVPRGFGSRRATAFNEATLRLR